MTFLQFCSILSSIEATTLRLEMTRLLAELYNQLQPEEIEPATYLLSGRIAPKYENLEFNFAEKMMIRAMAEFVPQDMLSGKDQNQLGLLGSSEDEQLQVVRNIFSREGDLGNVVSLLLEKSDGKQDNRTLLEVYSSLENVAHQTGEGSQERKLICVKNLLKESSPFTAKYVVRILLGTLRLGFSDMTLLDALSWAKTGGKTLRTALEDGYQVCANVAKVARVFLTQGLEAVQHLDVTLGVPIAPALCQRLHTADEMIEKMGKVIVEPKYDGTRVLIHVQKHGKDWQVRTFTRNLEESSGMFPELLSSKALDATDADEIILDSEAVGYDPVTGKLMPFQQTIQRKRKHDVAETAEKIPLRFFTFDVLYLNGKSLVHMPLEQRKKILAETVETSGVFHLAPFIVTQDPQELREFHAKQLAEGLEGAVIKQIESVYQPGRKGWSWVKFKEEEGATGQLSDTLDCVVMGYYVGQGKRTKFGIGAFLVGILEGEEVKTIAKIGTGLTDEQWTELYARCQPLVVEEKPEQYNVNKNLVPSFWVRPVLVTEIAADSITVSPIHTAKFALRFPRLVKFRDDKTVEQSTTAEELQTMMVK